MGCGTSSSNVNAVDPPPNNRVLGGTTQTDNGGAVLVSTPQNANLPLAVPASCTFGSKITKDEWNKHRKEYWETRVGGHASIWQTLHVVADAILDHDITFAQTLLDASNIKLPTGTLNVCYDETGYQYSIPLYCYVTPSDVVGAQSVKSESTPKVSIGTGTGKPLSNVKVRINPGDYNVKLTNVLMTSDTVLTLKNHICEMTTKSEEITQKEEEDSKAGSANLSNNGREIPPCAVERQRVMFVGKELKNHELLGDVGVDTQRVVQIFLRAEVKKS